MDSRAPMAQSHLCWLQNIDYGSNDFLRERRRDEFGCCCTPLPLLPRFHGNEGGAGQLTLTTWEGGRTGKVSKHIAFHSYPIQTAVPSRPSGSLPALPQSFGAGIMPTGLQAGLAGNSKNLSMLVKLSSRPSRAVSCHGLVKSPVPHNSVQLLLLKHLSQTKQNINPND